jgi:hypothetical protein
MDEETRAITETKASLRRLAGPSDAAVVERAASAIEDVTAAAAFVDAVGLDRLEAAVSATDDPAVEARGRAALEAFERFRRAARPGDAEAPGDPCDHFHRGRGTDLRCDAESPPG